MREKRREKETSCRVWRKGKEVKMAIRRGGKDGKVIERRKRRGKMEEGRGR